MENNSIPELVKSLFTLKEIVEMEYKDKILIWKLDENYSDSVRDFLSSTRNTILLDSEFYTRSKFAGATIDPTSGTSHCIGAKGSYPVIRA